MGNFTDNCNWLTFTEQNFKYFEIFHQKSGLSVFATGGKKYQGKITIFFWPTKIGFCQSKTEFTLTTNGTF